jgi:hypothetical protein
MAHVICPHCGGFKGVHTGVCLNPALHPGTFVIPARGWVCPICGRSNAPSVKECACFWESGQSEKMVERRAEEF